MKVGMDSYCYHRFFGEVYPDQKPPAKNMTMQDFLKRAKELEVDGVSLESCFFPKNVDQAWFKDLNAQLDEYKFDRVYAWAHPDGLGRGQDWGAYDGRPVEFVQDLFLRTIPEHSALGHAHPGFFAPGISR